MGIDYYNQSGMLVRLDQMIQLITKDNFQSLVKICCDHDPCGSEFKIVPQVVSYDDFIAALEELHKCIGEAGKYDGDARLANGLDTDDLTDLWDSIVEELDLNLPFLEAHIFNSGRQAMDCPLGCVCFILDAEDCYIKRISPKGKNLQNITGELNFVEWTDVSC